MQAAKPALAMEHATDNSGMNTVIFYNNLSQRTTNFRLAPSFRS